MVNTTTDNEKKSSILASLDTVKMELLELRDYITSSLMDNISTIPQKSTIKFCYDGNTYNVSGRHAQTLYWLVKHRNDGITPISVCNTAWRLANYVFHLRRTCNLAIKTDKEPHEGGYHARYTLLSDVDIISIVCDGETLFSKELGA